MDEKTTETIRLALKAVDGTNKLNRHIITCVTIILIVGFLVFGSCNIYLTHKMYDYEFVNTNYNSNENLNENLGGGQQ